MIRSIQWLERIPATLLVILAVVSINLGSALAISLFPVYGTRGMLFLRMALGAAILMLAYRHALARAIRHSPGVIALLGITITLQSGAFYESPFLISDKLLYIFPVSPQVGYCPRLFFAPMLCIPWYIRAVDDMLKTSDYRKRLNPAL